MTTPRLADLKSTQLSVIGAGRVGQTIAHLFANTAGLAVSQVLCRQYSHAEAASSFIGQGTAEAHMEALHPCDMWLIGVPDSAIENTSNALARLAQERQWQPSMAFHCSGYCSSDSLAALRKLGWSVASVHPALNFAKPENSVAQFSGTLCGIEGDEKASQWLGQAMTAIGGKTFGLDAQTKVMYHAAAVFCSNFTIALQDIAQQAWRKAGLAEEILVPLNRQLLETSVRNVLALGPSRAITGPAARGDAQTVLHQLAVVTDWSEEAGLIYRQLSDAAFRLADEGHSLASSRRITGRDLP